MEIARNGYNPKTKVPINPTFPEKIVINNPMPLTNAAKVDRPFVYSCLTTMVRLRAKINATTTDDSIRKRLSSSSIAKTDCITKKTINTRLETPSCINLLKVSFSHFPSRLNEEI